MLPNQGSNLDFTDPESVVLPITPLGTEIGCKDTTFWNYVRKKMKKSWAIGLTFPLRNNDQYYEKWIILMTDSDLQKVLRRPILHFCIFAEVFSGDINGTSRHLRKRKSTIKNKLRSSKNYIMVTNKEIKSLALQSLSQNWTMPVLTTLLFLALNSSSAIPYVGSLISILLILPLSYGFNQLFLKFIRGEKKDTVNNLFSGFEKYGRALGVTFLKAIFIFLWSLLLIIPGIIKSYSYAMTLYIALDNPELDANECIERSMKMMDGHKMDLFLLDLSFIGWMLLCILSLGIGFLWLVPYMQCSHSHFYEELKNENTL